MKCAITRKNRDKRGGHSGTNLGIVLDGSVDFTPIERALLKRISKKKMRRQHKMTHQAIQRELSNDFTWKDYEYELEINDAWYDDEPMIPYTMDELGWPYEESEDSYLNDWDYDPYPMTNWELDDDRAL